MSVNQSTFIVLATIILTATITSLVFLIPKWVDQFIQPGDTIITGIYSNNTCEAGGNPRNGCHDLQIRTEIDVTNATETHLEGEFFIRAYQDSELLGEKQLVTHFNPFAGDGGQDMGAIVRKEILSIENKDISEKFSLIYRDNVPGWNTSGYILNLKTLSEPSDLDGRLIDFYFVDGELDMVFPQ